MYVCMYVCMYVQQYFYIRMYNEDWQEICLHAKTVFLTEILHLATYSITKVHTSRTLALHMQQDLNNYT